MQTSSHQMDVSGQKFGLLTVICRGEPRRRPDGKTRGIFVCRCECGAVKSILSDNIRAGKIVSCGCTQRGLPRSISGGSRSAEYRAWYAMIHRCYNPNSQAFENYGGRGITVCDRWRDSYQAFLDDMGERPSADLSLDRINNDAGYSPSNCRWATRAVQLANRRRKYNKRKK